MKSLELLSKSIATVPTATAWYLADLGEAKGMQELFKRQSPQRLKALREHALVESTISSNRIEGIEVEPSRVQAIVFGKSLLRDRNEEEVRGYKDALKLIHEHAPEIPVTEETILRLHKLVRGEIWDSGQFKSQDVDITEKYSDGSSRVRFRTVPASETPSYMQQLVALWHKANDEQWTHPLIALACFNLDFL